MPLKQSRVPCLTVVFPIALIGNLPKHSQFQNLLTKGTTRLCLTLPKIRTTRDQDVAEGGERKLVRSLLQPLYRVLKQSCLSQSVCSALSIDRAIQIQKRCSREVELLL